MTKNETAATHLRNAVKAINTAIHRLEETRRVILRQPTIYPYGADATVLLDVCRTIDRGVDSLLAAHAVWVKAEADDE